MLHSIPKLSVRGHATRFLILAALVMLTGCGAAEEEGSPAKAKVAAKAPPVGLFFMTRYSSFSGLEKAVWYFAPDGKAYENPVGGFTAKALAAHPGRMGHARLEGESLTVAWTGGSEKGKEETGPYEAIEEETSFNWDLGIFTPVAGFAAGQGIAGKWQGGFSTGTGGNGGSVSRTLELRGDGTFTLSGAASLRASDSTGSATAGATGDLTSGKWTQEPYALTLGEKTAIAFPWDDEETPVNPDQFYFDGIMWSRLSE